MNLTPQCQMSWGIKEDVSLYDVTWPPVQCLPWSFDSSKLSRQHPTCDDQSRYLPPRLQYRVQTQCSVQSVCPVLVLPGHWVNTEQLMAAMSVNASAQRSGSKAFFGLRQPPAIPNTQSKKPEVDTKNSPDFMQYKITCVQLDKNSANYLHWRDIQLKQWTGIWKHFSFLSTNYLPCHNFSFYYFQKCNWLITITFNFVRRNSWGLQKLAKCHFLLAIKVLVFSFNW